MKSIPYIILMLLLLSIAIPAYVHAADEPPVPEMPDPMEPPFAPVDAPYIPGEILVKFVEGADPASILQEVNLGNSEAERVHSIMPAVTKFQREYDLEKDSNGWYWFRGKQYEATEKIPPEELFQEAYQDMSPAEQSLYRSYKITLPEGTTVQEALAALQNHPQVEYAEPNYIVEIPMPPR
jgi:hypothetical protein